MIGRLTVVAWVASVALLAWALASHDALLAALMGFNIGIDGPGIGRLLARRRR